MALEPLTYEEPLYQLLRDGNVKGSNKQQPQGGQCDLASCDFRHLDLCGLDAEEIDFIDPRWSTFYPRLNPSDALEKSEYRTCRLLPDWR